jgi:hypothetical protein
MTLQASGRAPAKEIAGLSCSARSLADAADLKDFDCYLNPSLHGFLESVKDLAVAWVESDSLTSVNASFGPDDLIKKLKDFSRASLVGGDDSEPPQRFGQREPSCTLRPLNHSELLTVVVDRSARLMALTMVKEMESIGENWCLIAPLMAIPKLI